jgi:cytochrome c553
MSGRHLRRCLVAPSLRRGRPTPQSSLVGASHLACFDRPDSRIVVQRSRDRWEKHSMSALLVTMVALLVSVVGVGRAGAAGGVEQAGYVKAVTCSGCHGFGGNSQVEAVPILAGMAPGYFKKAIEDYATGKRLSAEMEPFAKQVKLLGVDELAAFFAAQRRTPGTSKPDRAAVERGRAAAGPCASCHGPSGEGDAAKLIPRIAGQPAVYLRNQLLLFKADKRSPGDEAVTRMKAALKTMPDTTLADVAAYYSSLR